MKSTKILSYVFVIFLITLAFSGCNSPGSESTGSPMPSDDDTGADDDDFIANDDDASDDDDLIDDDFADDDDDDNVPPAPDINLPDASECLDGIYYGDVYVRIVDGGAGYRGSVFAFGSDGVKYIAASKGPALLLYQQTAANQWRKYCVDTFGHRPIFKIDSNDDMHFLFMRGLYNGDPYYLNTVTGGSYPEKIEPPLAAMDPVMALGPDGSAHVAFDEYQGQNIIYGTNESGAWVYESIAASNSPNPAVGVNNDGAPHLCFRANGGLVCQKKDAGVWTAEEYIWSGNNPVFEFDPLGNMHLLYSHDFLYVYWEQVNDWFWLPFSYTNSWMFYRSGQPSATVNLFSDPEDTYSPYNLDLEVDTGGFVHFTYGSGASGVARKYVTNRSSSFQIHSIPGDIGEWGDDLAVDATGMPYFSYVVDQNLKYSAFKNGAWPTRQIDQPNYDYSFLQAEWGPDGNIHATFYDVLTDQVMVAVYVNDQWTMQPLVSLGFLTDEIKLLAHHYDSNGKHHIALHTVGDETWHITDETGSFVSEKITVAGLDIYAWDMAVDSAGAAHILYWDWNNGLELASNRSGAWETRYISTGTRNCVDIEVDANDFLHMVSNDDATDEIEYRTDISGEWEDFYVVGNHPGKCVLALDSTGVPHIGYTYNNALHYVYKTTVNWVDEQISLDDWNFDMAIAPDDSVHFSYGKYRLSYATNQSGQWIVTQIFPFDVGFGSPSMLLDSMGQVHNILHPGSSDFVYVRFPMGIQVD